MKTVMAIVEGDGEVAALPILLRRLGNWLSPQVRFTVPSPIRVRREQFVNREEEFRRMLELAAAKCGDQGWILVLLDAGDDCPAEFGRLILQRAQAIVMHRRISVVLANREYEAWFIASASSLHGNRGLMIAGEEERSCDAIRGAKEWLSSRMPVSKYREVTDQPGFSALLDLTQARQNSRSFRKLCTEWIKNMST